MDTELTRSADHWLHLADPVGRAMFQRPEPDRSRLYRRLLGRWHPDHNPDPKAKDVFVRLTGWFRGRSSHSNSSPAGSTTWRAHDAATGRTFDVHLDHVTPTEWGAEGWGRRIWAEQYRPDMLDLSQNVLRILVGLPFADAKMAAQMAPLLPKRHAQAVEASGVATLVYTKDPRSIRLSDVLMSETAHGRMLPPEHVAWILSGLWNIACYLEHAKLTHNAISTSTVWIIPEDHTVHLWGGWQYACATGARLSAVPQQTAHDMTAAERATPTASHRLDHRLIQAVGRELLGDRPGMLLSGMPHVPSLFSSALLRASSGPAVESYSRWKKTLADSFGPPKFVACPWRAADVYGHPETT